MKELIIGGYAQGKLTCAKRRYPDAKIIDETTVAQWLEEGKQIEDCGRDAFLQLTSDESPEECDLQTEATVIVNHVHLMIQAGLLHGLSSEEMCTWLVHLDSHFSHVVWIADEIGNGIVPMEQSERIYREETGRILTALATKADKVVRITCGLEQVLKSN